MGKKSRQSRLLRSHCNSSATADLRTVLQRARSLHVNGEMVQAEALYKEVLRDDPQSFDALHLLGVIALQTKRIDEGIALIERALRVRPDDTQALANLGNGYLLGDQPQEALRRYDRAIALDPRFAGVLNNRGNALQSLGHHEEAAESFGQLMEVAPNFDFALGNCFNSRRHVNDWRDFDGLRDRVLEGIAAGRRVDRPFSFLAVLDSAAQQARCGQIYATYLCPHVEAALWRGEPYAHERIRVAYVSADFRDHVVARLMAPLYERHDRGHFEITGVSLSPQDGSEFIAQTKMSLDRFVDASTLSDQDLARRLRELEIDIAVDLTGFTQGCRPGVFARRPAPVQVNFLGFPASMGVPWMDYIIADDFVVPASHESAYSEKIARLPGCFQPNEYFGLSQPETETLTRAAVGLPDGCTVLCAFSNHYKLNPTMFAVWMHALSRAADSVLWLLGGSDTVRQRLRHEVAIRGVAPERLIFAERLPYDQHLKRLGLADLFLDTVPFNAGATAGDALKAGLPLVTCAGESFPSRMAGSLLRSIGLPELITGTLAEYQERATALAMDRSLLQRLRTKLAANRSTSPLFDGARYCRHLEGAYRQMIGRALRGEAPESFAVAADEA